MTQTANNLISDAIRKIGVIAEAQSIPAYMLDRGLTILNDVIAMWGASRIYIPYQSLLLLNLVQGQELYTVGPSDSYDLETDQIMEILELNILDPAATGVNFITRPLTELMYSNISYKTAQGMPSTYLLRNEVDYSEIRFQPLPYKALQAKILCKQRLREVEINEDLSQIPAHYRLGLKLKVAMLAAPIWGITLDVNQTMEMQKAIDSILAANYDVDYQVKKDETLNNYSYGIYNYWWV